MTTEELIEEAAQLPKPSKESAAEYAAKGESLAAELNRDMCARADLEALIGANNKEMMQDNHRNHARFMSSLCAKYHPEVLVNTVLWVFRAYRAHGFRLTYWPAQLDTWISLLQRELSEPAFASIHPLYHFMLIHQPDFVQLSELSEDPGKSIGYRIPREAEMEYYERQKRTANPAGLALQPLRYYRAGSRKRSK